MKETYKESLMLLVGLVFGLALGGLIVYLWLSDANTNVVQNSATLVSNTTTNATENSTASQKTSMRFEQFDFTAEMPTTWRTDSQVYTGTQTKASANDGFNSELAVSGPEGDVRFLFNPDGLGGGQCEEMTSSGNNPDVASVDTPEITTKAGVGTACHVVYKDGAEKWSIGMTNFVKTDVKLLKNSQGISLGITAKLNANSKDKSQVVLDVLQSASF